MQLPYPFSFDITPVGREVGQSGRWRAVPRKAAICGSAAVGVKIASIALQTTAGIAPLQIEDAFVGY